MLTTRQKYSAALLQIHTIHLLAKRNYYNYAKKMEFFVFIQTLKSIFKGTKLMDFCQNVLRMFVAFYKDS